MTMVEMKQREEDDIDVITEAIEEERCRNDIDVGDQAKRKR